MAPSQHSQDNLCFGEICLGCSDKSCPKKPVHGDAGAPHGPTQDLGIPSSSAAADQSSGHPAMGGTSPGRAESPRGPATMRVAGRNPQMDHASQQDAARQSTTASTASMNGDNPGHLIDFGPYGAPLTPPQEFPVEVPLGNVGLDTFLALPAANGFLSPPLDSSYSQWMTDYFGPSAVSSPFRSMDGYWSPLGAPSASPDMNDYFGSSAAGPGPLRGIHETGMQGAQKQSHAAHAYMYPPAHAGYHAPGPAASATASPAAPNAHPSQPVMAGALDARARYTCDVCNKAISHRSSLGRHMRQQHADVIDAYVVEDQRAGGQASPIELGRPLGECHECREGKPYAEQDAAKAHLDKVHGVRPKGTIEVYRPLIRRVQMTKVDYVAKREMVGSTSP
ncbi:hypothetical protein ESCO_001333 [Escovopsis weberi]|uniref:C2H2-type domain-containing protein n=1 Tax=Escovopsis weberi TaxID=150374 RepID=A0A0M8N4I3_ESCWE|nr:hypothetical protein ESCO_001333 [Escovopsis weberi]